MLSYLPPWAFSCALTALYAWRPLPHNPAAVSEAGPSSAVQLCFATFPALMVNQSPVKSGFYLQEKQEFMEEYNLSSGISVISRPGPLATVPFATTVKSLQDIQHSRDGASNAMELWKPLALSLEVYTRQLKRNAGHNFAVDTCPASGNDLVVYSDHTELGYADFQTLALINNVTPIQNHRCVFHSLFCEQTFGRSSFPEADSVWTLLDFVVVFGVSVPLTCVLSFTDSLLGVFTRSFFFVSITKTSADLDNMCLTRGSRGSASRNSICDGVCGAPTGLGV